MWTRTRRSSIRSRSIGPGFFLFEDLIVEEAVEGAEHLAAVLQLQVDPGTPAEAGIVAAISSLEGMGWSQPEDPICEFRTETNQKFHAIA